MTTTTKVDLTSGEQVQGTLPVANGGTGNTSLSAAGIEQLSNKNAASGYAGLGAGGYVAPAQLGSGTASSTTFLRGDNTYAVPPAPITWTTVESAAGTLTLSAATNAYVFTGTTTTWTLPAVSGNQGNYFHLESRGSGNITLNAAGADHIWWKSSITSMTIAPSASLVLFCDSSYWNAMSLDLANNSVGTLPIANGGTGNTTGLAATSTALATARTVQTNLASTSTASFNGTANITPGVTGTLPVGNGGIGVATLTGLAKGNGTSAFTAATAGTDYVAPGGALGTPSSGTLTNCTFPTLNQSTTGNAATSSTTAAILETRTAAATNIWTGTVAQYNAIGSPASTTLYFCT